MKFRMRTKIQRAMIIPWIIVLRPGCVRTISAARRAASVDPSTAIPISANVDVDGRWVIISMMVLFVQ